MKVKQITALICSLVLGFQISGSAKTLVQENAYSDLSFLEHLLDVKYAPKEWKHKLFQWDLKESTDQARLKLYLEENPSTKYCQGVFAQYISGLNDYHAGVTFFSTENSHLPYTIKLSNSRKCFVVDVHTYNSEINVGDEILEMDGVPIMEMIESVREGRGAPSDYAAAVRTLFSRSASLGHQVPIGIVTLKIRRPSGLTRTVKVKWRHIPEHIQDLSLIAPLIKDPVIEMKSGRALPLLSNASEKCLFTNEMVPYFWSELREQYKRGLNSDYNIGSKKGFFPDFGNVIWRAQHGPYHAYIFTCRDDQGQSHNIGFIRISTYSWTDMEDRSVMNAESPWEDFGEIIQVFEDKTEALIVDQTNNPGGSVFYLYALISRLTDKPLETPRHRMILTQNEVQSAIKWLNLLEGVETDEQARNALGNDMEGYPIDMNAVGYLQTFSDTVLKCWANGDINLSEPMPLLGFAKVHPHPECHYTHPVCILINEEDFSCGDLFPAIMKDNDRALIVGMTTAGAGGFVFNVEFPNRTGIKNLSLTGSLAVRSDGSYIENLGVAPHVYLDVTDSDLQTGRYSDYITNVKSLVLDLIEKESDTNTPHSEESRGIETRS
ncbi:protease-like activity factor CPAF [Chlamydia sp. 12-01]|uniref:protease-like activity factor CPAF n=1 Tax=Chlamydia sp. 12-01 TaxID=3002742 RepID=UPI0035D48B08